MNNDNKHYKHSFCRSKKIELETTGDRATPGGIREQMKTFELQKPSLITEPLVSLVYLEFVIHDFFFANPPRNQFQQRGVSFLGALQTPLARSVGHAEWFPLIAAGGPLGDIRAW